MSIFKLLVKNIPLVLCLASIVISFIGNRLTYLAIINMMMFSNQSIVGIGIVSIIKILPLAFFSPIIGKFVDKNNRATILITINILEALTILSIVFFQNPLYVLFVFLINCILDCFSDIAGFAYYENILEKDEIHSANALYSGVTGLINIIGPIIASLIIARFSNKVAFVIDSFTFVFSALCYSVCKFYFKKNVSSSTNNSKNQIASGTIKKSYSIVTSNPRLKSLFVTLFVIVLATESQAPLMFIFGKEHFNINVSEAAWFLSSIGAGSILGSILILNNTALYRNINTIFLVAALDGVALVVLSLSNSLILAVICFAIFGIASTFIVTIVRNVIQTEVSSNDIGKVYALKQTIIAPTKIFSMIFGAFMVMYYISCAKLFLISGIFEIVFCATIFLIHNKNKSTKYEGSFK